VLNHCTTPQDLHSTSALLLPLGFFLYDPWGLPWFSCVPEACRWTCRCCASCPLPGLTLCSWHSALRLSWTTALQQLPDTDHGGRMKSQMKGSAPTFRRSARLKKREAFRPFTSARASSDTDTVRQTEQNRTRDVSGGWDEQSLGSFLESKSLSQL
jgi:hypothetical protein